MNQIVWTLALIPCACLPAARGAASPPAGHPRSPDGDAWITTLQTDSPEKHLEFATHFPDSNYAALAAQRMLWLLERQTQAAGPNGSITQQFALRPLRRQFLPRFVSTLADWPSENPVMLAGWRDPYDWARQIDGRWWVYGLPAKERDLFSRELRQGYIGQLCSKDGNVRIRAAYALAYLGDPAALEPLLALSESSDETLRPPVGAIARLQDPDAEPFLRARLNQAPSPSVIAGLAALRNPDIVPLMIKLTYAGASWARESACEALGVIAHPAAVPALRERAGDGEEDDMVRLAAIEALGRIGDPSAVATLASTINKSSHFYWTSAHALGKIGSDEAVELLSKEIAGRHHPAPPLAPSEALAGCDHPRSARALLESFYQISVDPSAFLFGDEMRDRVFYGANDEYRRYGCGKSLAVVWSFRSTDRLLAILASEGDAMRGCAAYALGAATVRDPRAVEALIPLLKDKGVAASAAFALGELHDLRALEPLIAALAHEDAVVRRFAAHGLGDLGDQRAVAPLARLLGDKDTSLAAVLALQRMKAKEAAGDLAAMLTRIGESAPEVGQPTRRDLLEALRWIGNPAVISAVLAIARSASDPLHAEAAQVVAELSQPRPDADQRDREVYGPFATMTDDEVIAMLVDPERATYTGQRVFAELIVRHRLPESLDEAIRYFVLIGARDDLMALWPRTRRVLLADLHSRSPQRQIYAARCLIRIGHGDNTAAELRDALLASDNKQLALDYFHCGNQQLRQAALDWSAKSGTVLENQPAGVITWGVMKED